MDFIKSVLELVGAVVIVWGVFVFASLFFDIVSHIEDYIRRKMKG